MTIIGAEKWVCAWCSTSASYVHTRLRTDPDCPYNTCICWVIGCRCPWVPNLTYNPETE